VIPRNHHTGELSLDRFTWGSTEGEASEIAGIAPGVSGIGIGFGSGISLSIALMALCTIPKSPTASSRLPSIPASYQNRSVA
jgi:hypothetical protein